MQIRNNVFINRLCYLIIISVLTFFLYYLLWWITDKSMFISDGFSFHILCCDYGYCLLLTSLTLFICHTITAIPYFKDKDISRIVFLIFIIFAFSLGIAQGISMLLKYNHPISKEVRILDAYFLSILTTLVSTIFISKYYCNIVSSHSQANNMLRMKLLKSQLDPHFMFNSLNTLAELIHEDPLQAEEFTIRLSNVYRYILHNLNSDIISIRDAIYVTREYCKLLESRYPNNFDITIDPRIDQSQYMILPLSMQQLIENAIKHNRHSSVHPLKITFTIDDRYITVRNTLNSIIDCSIQSHGIGLKNLIDRYHCICNLPVIINKTDSYYEVKLPIIKDYENIDH